MRLWLQKTTWKPYRHLALANHSWRRVKPITDIINKSMSPEQFLCKRGHSHALTCAEQFLAWAHIWQWDAVYQVKSVSTLLQLCVRTISFDISEMFTSLNTLTEFRMSLKTEKPYLVLCFLCSFMMAMASLLMWHLQKSKWMNFQGFVSALSSLWEIKLYRLTRSLWF